MQTVYWIYSTNMQSWHGIGAGNVRHQAYRCTCIGINYLDVWLFIHSFSYVHVLCLIFISLLNTLLPVVARKVGINFSDLFPWGDCEDMIYSWQVDFISELKIVLLNLKSHRNWSIEFWEDNIYLGLSIIYHFCSIILWNKVIKGIHLIWWSTVYIFIYLFVYLFIYLHLFIHPSIYTLFCRFIYLIIYSFIHLFNYLFIHSSIIDLFH